MHQLVNKLLQNDPRICKDFLVKVAEEQTKKILNGPITITHLEDLEKKVDKFLSLD